MEAHFQREKDAIEGLHDAIEASLPDSDFQVGAQPLSFQEESSGDEDDRFMLTDAERDVRDRAIARAGKTLPRPVAQKRERTPEPETLTIHEYFEMTEVPIRQRVSICRSYASYISAQCPPAPRKKQKK